MTNRFSENDKIVFRKNEKLNENDRFSINNPTRSFKLVSSFAKSFNASFKKTKLKTQKEHF